jgi:hypothetical protein
MKKLIHFIPLVVLIICMIIHYITLTNKLNETARQLYLLKMNYQMCESDLREQYEQDSVRFIKKYSMVVLCLIVKNSNLN